MIFQMTGLSGAGKSTLSEMVQLKLIELGYKTEIIDGDFYRKNLCKDLGFSKEDRIENIRRLGFVANILAKNKIISIIAAINPFEEIRNELKTKYGAKVIFIDCDLETLTKRDTKGLYKKALLPDNHTDKIFNLTGINDPFNVPIKPDLLISTSELSIVLASQKLIEFILSEIKNT